MTLHPDWRRLLRYAWSIRLLMLAGVLSGCEVALPLIQPIINIPTGIFAGLSALSTCGAFVARLMAQKEFGADGSI